MIKEDKGHVSKNRWEEQKTTTGSFAMSLVGYQVCCKQQLTWDELLYFDIFLKILLKTRSCKESQSLSPTPLPPSYSLVRGSWETVLEKHMDVAQGIWDWILACCSLATWPWAAQLIFLRLIFPNCKLTMMMKRIIPILQDYGEKKTAWHSTSTE